MKNNLATVAIVGKPNVGKSSLFNRLVEKRLSITSDQEGTTRDRIYATCSWIGNEFNVVDTGGFGKNLSLSFQEEINQQVDFAINQADLLIFVISGKEGLQEEDLYLWQRLKRVNDKKIILAVNKLDNNNDFFNLYEGYKLGIKDVLPISSLHGLGINDLLDSVVKNISIKKNDEIDATKISLIGKPNVGKSTLLNKLLKEDRAIVSDIPGTTRDMLENNLTINGKNYVFIDTAGLKKNKKALSDIEWYAELRSTRAITSSDMVLLILDYQQEITRIDLEIYTKLKDLNKPLIILINKKDLLKTDLREAEKEIKHRFRFIPWLEVVFISALKGENLDKIFKKIEEIKVKLNYEIPPRKVTEFLQEIQMIKRVPSRDGKHIRLTYGVYTKEPSSRFIIFSNYPEKISSSYQKFLRNQLLQAFNLYEIPIKIIYKRK